MKVLPGWTRKTLTELAEYVNGYAFTPDDWGEEGLPIVRIEQLKNPDTTYDYFSGQVPSANVIDDGDLIFSWSASLFLKIWDHGPAALNQHLFKVMERPGVDRRFLKHFIEFHLPALVAASHGSTMQHITRKELARFAAPVPESKEEQAKIAEIISTIDRAIEQTEAILSKQKRIKNGFTNSLLTQGIDEHGVLRSEETHSFQDSVLGRIPVEWQVRSISSVLAQPPKNGVSPVESESWNGAYVLGLGCLTPEGFAPKQLKYAPAITASMEAAHLHTGDFLISRSNTRALVGLAGIFKGVDEPCIYPDLMIRLKFTKDVSTEYMEQSFMAPMLRHQIENAAIGTSGSMVKISAGLINGFQFAKPPLDEQRRIVVILRDVNEYLRCLHEGLEKFRAIKVGLMQDLLSGKKRVTALLEPEPKREKAYA